MAKRKVFPSILYLVFVVFILANTGCSGTPSDFNSVVLHASSLKITAGQTVTITASVPKDTTGAGVNWVFTPGAGAPVPPGTFTPTSVTTATYAAPTNAVAAQFTVTIQATSIAIPAETNSVTITIKPTPALAITTTTLPNGVAGAAYPPAGMQAQLQAAGGVPPYTWTLTSAPGTLDGLTLATDGTISGTPTAPGVFNTFTVQVADSETPTPMTVTSAAGQLSITITNLLSGNYAFQFSGFNSTGVVVAAGSFVADGAGNITGGVEDVNSIQGPHTNQTFTGTYTIGSDNRGVLIFASLAGTPRFDFAIDSQGIHGRMIEFDSTGVRGSGQLEQQNTPTCGGNTPSGSGTTGTNFVMGVAGAAGNFTGITPGPIAMVGRFTAEVPTSGTSPGNIDLGEVDVNTPQQVIAASPTFSGIFQTTSQAARCAMILTTPISAMSFSIYPIASVAGVLTQAFVVETDTLSVTTPYVTVGKLIHQIGYPFTTPRNLLAAPSVAGLSGNVIPPSQSAFLPYVAVAQLNPTGGGAFTMPLIENIGGVVGSFTGPSVVSANLNAGDTFGRVDTNLITPIAPVLYVFGPNAAFCILNNINAPVLGVFEPQSKGSASSFSTSLVAGTFAQGTAAPPTTATINFSGVTTLTSTGTTTGTISGTQDTSTPGGNIAAQVVTGTLALSSTGQTDGSGTLTLTAPAAFTGQFFIVSPSKLAVIETTAGNPNPVLTFLGNCESTCGED